MLIKKRATRGHPLSNEDDHRNIAIEDTRRFIELEFGRLKQTFRIAEAKYRGARGNLSKYIRFCFAMYNEITLFEKNHKVYVNEWTGNIPKLEVKVHGAKRVSDG